MMGNLGIKMNVTCKTSEVLARLQDNRGKHAKIVAEAREGYIKAAQAELEKRLAKIREGKIVGLTFQLSLPKDCTGAYDTVIEMLQSHQSETIELSATEFRQLMMDQWDWSHEFLYTNAMYSASLKAEEMELPES